MPANFVSITPENVKWDLEATTPWGAVATPLAYLDGDSSTPGIYVVRVNYPPKMFTRPHWHGEDRHIVVLKGTWYMGTGDNFDPSKAVPLPVGSYAKHPAGGVHWDGAKDEEVVLQVIGIGPLTTELVWKDGPFIGPAN